MAICGCGLVCNFLSMHFSEDLTADDEPPPVPVAVTNAEDLEKELDIAEEEEGEEGKTLANTMLYRQMIPNRLSR